MASVYSRVESLQLARNCALEVVNKRSQHVAFHPADDLLAVLSRITMEAIDCALNAQPFCSEALEQLVDTITIRDRSTDLSKFAFSFSKLMMELSGSIIGSEQRETTVKLEPDNLLAGGSELAYTDFFNSPSTTSDVKLEMEVEEPLGLVKDEEERCEMTVKQHADQNLLQFYKERREPIDPSSATHFYCRVCQTIVPKSEIEHHEETLHREMWMRQARKCPLNECDYRSISVAALEQHKNLHHRKTTNIEINYLFPIRTNCPYCKTFVHTLAEFITHINIEHRDMWNSQVPIYICNQCDFACSRVYQMIQHWNERGGACKKGLQFDYAAAADVVIAAWQQMAAQKRREAAAAAKLQAKRQQQAAAEAARKQEKQAAAAAAKLQRHAAAAAKKLQKRAAAGYHILDAAARAAVADVVAELQFEREQHAKAPAGAAIAADAATADEPCGSAKRPRMEDL